jgi:hypothetical protein
VNRPFEDCGIRSGLVLCCALVSVVSLAGLVTAGQDTASIVGQVKDESGAILPGVTVTATSPALQVPSITDVTDERGEYRLSPLPAGAYSLEYTITGFQTIKRDGILLSIGFSAKLDEVMKIGALEESVTVSGASPVVDVSSSASKTQLNSTNIELIPTGRNGLEDLLAQSPGVRPEYSTGGSGMSSNPTFHAFGQVNEYWSTLEGIVTTPPNGGQGNFYDYSSFDYSTVQAIGNDAEMPRRGVFLAAVVKSGGNEFHGELFGSDTGDKVQSDNGVAGNSLIKRWDGSAQAGGKIIKNKLWYFAAYRRRHQDTSVPNLFSTIQPPFPAPDGSNRLGGPQSIGPNAGLDSQIQPYYTGKLSYQMTPSNRIIFFNQTMEKHWIHGPTTFQSQLSPANEQTWMHIGKGEWQYVRGNSMVFDVESGYWALDVVYPGRTTEPTSSDNAYSGSAWGDASSHGNLPYNYRETTSASVSSYRPDMFFGNHDLKLGGIWSMAGIERIWDSRSDGTTTPNLTSGNYTLIFNKGVPFEFGAFNSPIHPYNDTHYLGLFVRDSWTIKRRLTANLGIRFSRDNGYAPPQCRSAGDWPFTQAQCYPLIQDKIFNSFAPRTALAWDVTGDGKTVIKGGWNRFDHMRDATPEVDNLNQNVFTTTTFLWHDRTHCNCYVPGDVNLDPNGPDFVNITGTAAEIPNPNEKQPKVNEYSLSVERELIKNMAIRATGVYSLDFNTYMYVGVQRPYSAYTVPITAPILATDGVTPTGRFLTWYDVPSNLAGLSNSQTMTVNPGSFTDQTFKSFEIATAKRVTNNWEFNASYSVTWVHMPYGSGNGGSSQNLSGQSGTAGNGIEYYNPNGILNSANDIKEWLGKVSGAYMFPWGVTFSGNFENRSGLVEAPQQQFTHPGGVTPQIVLYTAPIGSHILPAVNTLDLRLAKTFNMGGTRKVEARVNIFNALNINTVLTDTIRVGPQFGVPTGQVLPRIFDFSVGYRF